MDHQLKRHIPGFECSVTPGITILQMTSADLLQYHIEILREGLESNVSDSALDQLVANVTEALVASFENGDLITVAETGMRLKTRLQTLNAINQGYKLVVLPGSSVTYQ